MNNACLSLEQDSMMRPLKDKRKAMEARSDDGRRMTALRKLCNSLKISNGVVLSKEK
jgi:hypothetical protein